MSLPSKLFGRSLLNNLRSPRLMAAFSTDALSVEHNEKDKEFAIKMGQDKALLNYDFIGENKVDLYHTEVPQVFQGKGVAKLLAKSAFDFVVNKNLKMKVSCTYLQKYLKDNPNEDYLKRLL